MPIPLHGLIPPPSLPGTHSLLELFDSISSWSTQVIHEKRLFVKELPSSPDNAATYCVVEVTQSSLASRLFIIVADFFGCLDAANRLAVMYSLKVQLLSCRKVTVLPKPLGNPFTARRAMSRKHPLLSKRSRLLGNCFCSESWKLAKDPELLPLLIMRRKSTLENFFLLDSSTSHATFAKYYTEDGVDEKNATSSNLYTVQYVIQSEDDHVMVSIYMEQERGLFLVQRYEGSRIFSALYESIKRGDQECGRALRSRRSLLQEFQEETTLSIVHKNDQENDVRRLLPYSYQVSKKLRFFHPGSGRANSILASLTTQFILTGSMDLRVAKLSVPSDLSSIGPGIWFIIRHDNHNLSLVHFALNEELEDTDGFMYRDLTFHIVGVSDLYWTRDDTDGNSFMRKDSINEHTGVIEIIDSIEKMHGYNYARSSYLALRDTATPVKDFDARDFAYLLKFVSNTKVADVYVSRENDKSTGSRLLALIDQMLKPIPGGGKYFYFIGEEGKRFINDVMESSQRDRIQDTMGNTVDYDSDTDTNEGKADISHIGDHDLVSVPSRDSEVDILDLSERRDSLPLHLLPPIFVSFVLNDEVASLSDISALDASSNLTAYLTIFEAREGNFGSGSVNTALEQSLSRLPELYNAVALQLMSKLESFVSEQALERLRHIGSSISDMDLKIAVKSLLEAENVASTKVPIDFYVAGGLCVHRLNIVYIFSFE